MNYIHVYKYLTIVYGIRKRDVKLYDKPMQLFVKLVNFFRI